MEGVKLTQLRVIEDELGAVMHAFKSTEPDFSVFGEAYFSQVHQGKIKAWKKHQRMTMNLVVPVGEVRFVIYDDRPGSATFQEFYEILLSPKNYQRLTVAPQLWTGFQGISAQCNLLLNIATIPHDPQESVRCDVNAIPYTW